MEGEIRRGWAEETSVRAAHTKLQALLDASCERSTWRLQDQIQPSNSAKCLDYDFFLSGNR